MSPSLTTFGLGDICLESSLEARPSCDDRCRGEDKPLQEKWDAGQVTLADLDEYESRERICRKAVFGCAACVCYSVGQLECFDDTAGGTCLHGEGDGLVAVVREAMQLADLGRGTLSGMEQDVALFAVKVYVELALLDGEGLGEVGV